MEMPGNCWKLLKMTGNGLYSIHPLSERCVMETSGWMMMMTKKTKTTTANMTMTKTITANKTKTKTTKHRQP